MANEKPRPDLYQQGVIRDTALLLAACLDGDKATMKAIIESRVDGRHRDEVKGFILQLTTTSASIAETWQKGSIPRRPVASILREQAANPHLSEPVDRIREVKKPEGGAPA